jgi:hypothetical protein
VSAKNSRLLVIADAQFGAGATGSAPGTWHLGLSKTVSAGDGTGFTEPVGGAYARAAVTNNATNFPAATVSSTGLVVKVNGVAIAFPSPTADWGQLVEFGWFLAATGGNPEWSFPLDSPITPRSGVPTVEVPIGLLLMPFKG